jgi:elongation factor P--(R)-beta-lysine ligase
MTDRIEWKSTATLERLRLRARLLSEVRRFFDSRGYWEVDTPIVSQERVVDANLEPFLVTCEPKFAIGANVRTEQPTPRYLQTSPEFAMKRLLAAGADAIYQIAHVFRYGESGKLHNPEFTMVEWYRVGDTHHDQMQVVEDLVVNVCKAARDRGIGEEANAVRSTGKRATPGVPQAPFLRTTYRDAFVRHAGIDAMVMETDELSSWASRRELHPPPGLSRNDRDGWLNWLLAELVEPQLGCDRPEFLLDYPASQAALARIRPGQPPVAERFELYWQGIELCNGYHELGDAEEICRRITTESERRAAEGLLRLPVPQRFLASIRAGLPDCTGGAVGFDRLMMTATGAQRIDEVIPLPFDQA